MFHRIGPTARVPNSRYTKQVVDLRWQMFVRREEIPREDRVIEQEHPAYIGQCPRCQRIYIAPIIP